MSEQQKAQHTPGAWIRDGHSIYGPRHAESKHPNGRVLVARVVLGSHRADPQLDGGCDRFGFDSEADTRLIVAAVNSYALHFGPDAVAAAEQDMLGECIEALRKIELNASDDGQFPHDDDLALNQIRLIAAAILARVPQESPR